VAQACRYPATWAVVLFGFVIDPVRVVPMVAGRSIITRCEAGMTGLEHEKIL
jgi:hypothetical protein